jgi:hypothetical protein
MCFVSVVTSIGQIIEIPILLWSLAQLFQFGWPEEAALPFDSNFIAMLEVGTNEEQPHWVITSYAFDWWNNHCSAFPMAAQRLSTVTVEACLEYHTHRLRKLNSLSVFENPPGTPALTLAKHPSTTEPDDCPDCEIYHNLAGDMYSELVSLLRFSSTMAVSSENDVDVASRRASGFFILQEKVTLKELLSQSLNIKCQGYWQWDPKHKAELACQQDHNRSSGMI